MIRQLTQWGSIFIYVGATVATVAAICRITAGAFLSTLVTEISMIGTCTVAGAVVYAIAVVSHVIISAILGAIEKKKLEAAIADLDNALRSFEPATRHYTKTIYEVLGTIRQL